jgi:Ferritin-like
LQEIVEQGEGEMESMFDDDGDLAHYYRFEQLKYARAYKAGDEPGTPTGGPVAVDYDAVYPMLANPRTDDFADPDLRAVAATANRAWSKLLGQLERSFNGEPGQLIPAVHSMFSLRDGMLVLLANPLDDHPGRHAGPTFEWAA